MDRPDGAHFPQHRVKCAPPLKFKSPDFRKTAAGVANQLRWSRFSEEYMEFEFLSSAT
jgi:hypothetical protein